MLSLYFGKMMILGITKGNVSRLEENKPMRVKFLNKEPLEELIIIYGEDKPSILKQLESYFEDKLPEWMWEEAKGNPE